MHRRQTLHPRRLRRTHGADEGAAQGPWRAQTGRFKAGYMGKPWKSTTNRDTKVNFTKGYKLILTSQNFSLFVSMGISTVTSKEFVIFCRVSGWLAMFRSYGHPWSLWIQPYLLRKYDWGMMTRGWAVPSQWPWIHRGSLMTWMIFG